LFVPSSSFVAALIEGVFHGAFDEESGLAAGLLGLQTFLALEVTELRVTSPNAQFPTVPARYPRACRLRVARRIVTASENLVAGGAYISATLLLDRSSSSAWCIDQDACCGAVVGPHEGGGGIRRTATDADVL